MLTACSRTAAILTSALVLAHYEIANAQAQAEFGLDARPVNTSCTAFDPPSGGGSVVLERVFSGLNVSNLAVLTQAPNSDSYWYFATRDGLIGRFANLPTVTSYSTVLDLRSTVNVPYDGGLIQLVFHPDFPTDRRVFLNYSRPAADGVSVADIIISSMESTDAG